MSLIMSPSRSTEIQSFAFKKVKPLCDSVAKFGDVEDINKLKNTLHDIDDHSLQFLQEYLLFPIRLWLSRKGKEKQIIACVNFLKYIFSRSQVTSKIFYANFVQLFSVISVPENINKVSDVSEEVKLAICESVSELVLNASEEILKEMYSPPFRLPLAQSFFVLSTLLSHEKSKTLRKALLRLIGILTYSCEYINDSNENIKELASEALTPFFPGISIALHKVVCGDNKQGHVVITMALRILGDLIVLVVNDNCYKSRNLVKADDSKSKESNMPVIIKNSAWFEGASSKIKILIKNVTLLSSNENWKVRLEFLKFAKSLLFSCIQSLENCVSILLPAVFALSVDKYDAVSSYGKTLVNKLTHNFQAISSISLFSLIEDDIYTTTSKLIKSKLSANDAQKLSTLKSLQGYIQVLGPSVNKLLFSMPHLEKVILSLINLLEFDTSTVQLVEEVSVSSKFEESVSPLWPRKKFAFFEDEEILSTICSICYILGNVGNARLLIDYLMEKLQSSNLYAMQSIYLVGNIIKGIPYKLKSSEGYVELVGDVIDELLSPAVWELPIHDTEQGNLQMEKESLQQNEILCLKTYSGNIQQICLSLETMAKCAETLGADFKIHLMKILCPVMERAGSSNFTLSMSGRLCLYSIAKYCNYSSVIELIKENSDYLVNSVTIHFHHYLYRPEVAVVLRVAMEESDAEALALFRDSVFQILNILDYNQDNAYPLLKVLFSVVMCVRRWFPSMKKVVSSISSKDDGQKDLKTALLEHQAQKREALKFLSDDADVDDLEITEQHADETNLEIDEQHADETNLEIDEQHADETNLEISEQNADETCSTETVDDEKEVVPLHVNIVKDILKRCIHLQSSKNLYLRMLALETSESCILALGDYENHLHPLVHEFWSPFVQRFSEDVIVILKSFAVLLVIATECQDFVRVRTLKEVIPRLIDFLKKEYSSSLLKNGFRNYQWTNAHKLQLLLLSEMGTLYTKLDVGEKDIASLVEVCLPYLNNKQPKVLQNAAAKSIKALTSIDPDALWLYYNEMYSKVNVLTPPHQTLSVLYFPHSSGTDTSVEIDF